MNRTECITALLCACTLSACQSNSQAQPGIVVVPESVGVSSADTATTPSSTESTTTDSSALSDISLDAFTTNQAQKTGNVEAAALTEISGLASSTRRVNTFWAINDGGNGAELFALNHLGAALGSWPVMADNRDWEDMASAWINGESYLFIADIGDNLQVKDEHVIHVIAEPNLDANDSGPLVPLNTIRFRYPDNAHNAESLAVGDEWLYVITKEPLNGGTRQASLVYRIPLSLTPQAGIVDAELIAQLAIPRASIEANVIASLSGVDISQPTAFDIDQQNQVAYLLTYRNVYRYQREANQSWAEVLAQPRNSVHNHSLAQAEALAISSNGVVWFTTEKRPAPLWALPATQ